MKLIKILVPFTQLLTFIILLGLSAPEANAQNTVTVRIIDNLTKKPIKDVAVKNKSVQTSTNLLGYFQINANPGDSILMSHDEYESRYVVIQNEFRFTTPMDVKNLKFTDGLKNFYSQLGQKLKYPPKARSKKIQGNIYAEFIIDSLGAMTNLVCHNDTKILFTEDIQDVFINIKGTWPKEYAGRKFLLPIKYRLASEKSLEDGFFNDVVVDRRLGEVVITAYGVNVKN